MSLRGCWYSCRRRAERCTTQGATCLYRSPDTCWPQVMSWWPFRQIILRSGLRQQQSPATGLHPHCLFHFGDATEMRRALGMTNRLTGCAALCGLHLCRMCIGSQRMIHRPEAVVRAQVCVFAGWQGAREVACKRQCRPWRSGYPDSVQQALAGRRHGMMLLRRALYRR